MKIPEGWKLVPIFPTREMVDAGAREDGEATALIVWQEMLEAAPPPPPL